MLRKVKFAALVPALLMACASSAYAGDAASVYAKAKGAVVTVRAGKMDGSGFVIGDGTLVMTCYHVVKGATKIRVDEAGKEAVKLVGFDAKHDVALLALGKPLKAHLEFRNGPPPEPGTKVYAIGTSLGFLDHTISEGIVSGRREMDEVSYLQISAAVSHGNSGGPVLDDEARIVGMADFAYEEGQNLNFAIANANLTSAMASIQAKAANVVVLPVQKGILGRLGKAKEETPLLAAPRAGAKMIASATKGLDLVVRKTSSPLWVAVVMNDGQQAFADASAIKILNYEVTGHPIPPTPPAPPAARGKEVAYFAVLAKGSPSAEGGSRLDKGIGNGEFIKLAAGSVGIDLPAAPAEQVKCGLPVNNYENLLPGDRLYLWNDAKGAIDRGAIYVGGGYIVMADETRGKVISAYLEKPLRIHIVAARRDAGKG